MNNQVEKFDPSTLMQGVKDRIKSTFVSLIPDDQWETMVKAEISRFFELKHNNNFNNSRYELTEFSQLCQSVIKEKAVEKIKEYLNGSEFLSTWDSSGHPVVSETVKKLIIDNSGAMLAQILSGPFIAGIQQMKYDMQNMRFTH